MSDLLCILVFVFDVFPQLSLVIRLPDVVCKGIESTLKLRMKMWRLEKLIVNGQGLLTPIAPTHIAAVKVEVLLKTPLYSPPSNPIINPNGLKLRGDGMIRKDWWLYKVVLTQSFAYVLSTILAKLVSWTSTQTEAAAVV